MLPEHSHRPNPDSPSDNPLEAYKGALRERFPIGVVVRNASRRRRTRRSVTAVMMCAAAALGTWFADPAYQTQEFRTAIGEHRDWQLADGSRLALDTHATAHIAWHLRSRRLTVDGGEVLIEVAHGERPFITNVGNAVIYDIGTSFSVRREADAVRVGVLAGAVNVAAGPNEQVTLHTEQAADIVAHSIGPTRPFDVRAARRRSEGRLTFDGTPLRLAIVELDRYRTAPIVLARGTGDLRLSGEFDSRNVEALLDMLPGVLPITVTRASDGAVTIARR